MNVKNSLALFVALWATLTGCTCGGKETCDPAIADACEQGFTCEAIQGESDAQCFPATTITGRVFNATNDAAVEGARVVAIDAATNAAASNVVLTDAEGRYSVPVRLTRSTTAAQDQKTNAFTLRVSAEGFQNFPSPIRQAIPVNVTRSEENAVSNNTRDVALLPLAEDLATLSRIEGHALEGSNGVGGVLVVAEGGGRASSAVTDSSGAYAILNLPAGTYSVRGYIGGKAFAPVEGVVVEAATPKTDVDLSVDAAVTLTKVVGTINMVEGAEGNPTVVLVVAATGEVPPGLSTVSAANNYAIAEVAPGTFHLFASYDNDGNVMDPDPQQLQQPIVVSPPTGAVDGVITIPGFKVTVALDVVRPGLNPVTETPVSTTGLVFEWKDDSSELFYGFELFNAFGERIYGSAPSATQQPAVKLPAVSGSATVTLTYGDTSNGLPAWPTLTSGQTYQWRATSYRCRTGGGGACSNYAAISQTENLRGIFTVE